MIQHLHAVRQEYTYKNYNATLEDYNIDPNDSINIILYFRAHYNRFRPKTTKGYGKKVREEKQVKLKNRSKIKESELL
ncbi:unnamed protein product [Blepharisma stoltei]|uniref:Uncharacterized protein n=1 Tax=Blepharisma stoltei TaxID=1481888 RepID=A0AAU9IMF5_9CILI|nr:unnamed protein product [Blepharisma stoltei]